MIRALCKNRTFRLTALDGSVMFTKPCDVNEIEEKFTTDPTYVMAVAAGDLEPIKSDRQASKKLNEKTKVPKNDGKPEENDGKEKVDDDE